MVDFQELYQRLTLLLLARVASGELTERGIARISGVSQPHIHNVLKGKRLLSPGSADAILRELHLDVFDLIELREFLEWQKNSQ